MKTLAIMLGNPGISNNEIVKQLHIQKSSWPHLRGSLEMQRYIECERNDNGRVVGISLTDHGARGCTDRSPESLCVPTPNMHAARTRTGAHEGIRGPWTPRDPKGAKVRVIVCSIGWIIAPQGPQ